jgi:hypothetical protein
MAQADSKNSTTAAVDTTRRFETLKDAEDALMEQGFKLVPHTCNWIDDAARIDAGVYPVEDAYGISKYRIEYRALDATPTRRRFLTMAAIGSIVGAGGLAFAAAAPNDVPQAVTAPRHSWPDPVFGLIEAHRRASAAHGIALGEQARLEQLGEIDAAWSIAEQPCHAEFNAFDALLSAEATTVPGIVAQLAYLQDIAEHDAWMFSDREDSAPRLLKGFAASIANVMAVLS